MPFFENKVPNYLLGKFQLIGTVTFTALFAVVFYAVSTPFSETLWFRVGASMSFVYTLAFFLLSLLLVSMSKRILYLTGKTRAVSFVSYVLWNLIEVLLVCALYTFLTLRGVNKGYFESVIPAWGVFLDALQNSFVALVIPYIISGMYFAIIDKNNTIRVMNYSYVVSDEVLPPKDEKKITLFDNSGVLKFSVSSTNLYYIESDDNYIKVWYADHQASLKQYMLRCRLKTVEESFIDSSLVRCHRKYIVNMDKVKVLRKEKDSYLLELDNEEILPIPITKTYETNVLARFNSIKA